MPDSLIPELAMSMRTINGRTILKHLLVVNSFIPSNPDVIIRGLNLTWTQLMNNTLQQKRDEVTKAEAQANWVQAILLYERHFRMYYLMNLQYSGRIDRAQLRELLTCIWYDTEAPHNLPQRGVLDLFDFAGYLTDDVDPQWTPAPPEHVTIYRGCQPGHARQLSWTTDRDKARWFADRFSVLQEEGTVYQAEIRRNGILARFIERHENEVVVNPRRLPNVVQLSL